MSRQEEFKVSDSGEVEFDFGFDNFRAMGFQFTGTLIQCRIKQPEKDEYTFVDKRTGKEITKKSKPQLELLIEPHDFQTKSGNPIPEYLPLTHNVRSKLGIFIEHLKNLNLSLGSDPSQIEGMTFEWETKEVDFGGAEPVRVNVPMAVVDALSGATKVTSAPPASGSRSGLSADEKASLALVINGVSPAGILAHVASTPWGKNPKVIAGLADRSLLTTLVDEGYILEGSDGSYAAAA